jgi:hypothetical protein
LSALRRRHAGGTGDHRSASACLSVPQSQLPELSGAHFDEVITARRATNHFDLIIRCAARRSVSIARSESNADQKIVGSVVEAYTGTHIQLKVRSDEIDQSSDRVIARSG